MAATVARRKNVGWVKERRPIGSTAEHGGSASLDPPYYAVDRFRGVLQAAGLGDVDQVMATTAGRCLRVLAERENWYLRPRDMRHARGMYLKKHRVRSLWTRICAAVDSLGVGWVKRSATHQGCSMVGCAALHPPYTPRSAGRVEAENALALEVAGIRVMPLVAFGERLHADGRLESFLLTEELDGYCELQDFVRRRFPPSAPLGEEDRFDLRWLVMQVADIARRFHAAGFNHRDFYCCHFLAKETSPREFDVRLIDLQRVQRRRWFRRRWIVKDLAQLASMSPDDCLGPRDKILFLRTYLGVQKLRPQDKRLVRDVLRKLASIRRRERSKR